MPYADSLGRPAGYSSAQRSERAQANQGMLDWGEMLDARRQQRQQMSRHISREDQRRRSLDMMALMRQRGPQRGYPEGVDVHPDFRHLYTPQVVRSFQDAHGRWLDVGLAQMVPLNFDLPYHVDPSDLEAAKDFVDPTGFLSRSPMQAGLGRESLAFARMRQEGAGWADDLNAYYAGEHMAGLPEHTITEYRPTPGLEEAKERIRAAGDAATVTPEERALINRWNKFTASRR